MVQDRTRAVGSKILDGFRMREVCLSVTEVDATNVTFHASVNSATLETRYFSSPQEKGRLPPMTAVHSLRTAFSQPNRWFAKDCINVGTLITYYDDSLSDFRKTHHGSYMNDRSLAAAQADADFQSRYGTTIGDFVTDAVGWTGVASFVIGLAADATGRAAIMDCRNYD